MSWVDSPKCAPHALNDFPSLMERPRLFPQLRQAIHHLTCVTRKLGWSHPLACCVCKEPLYEYFCLLIRIEHPTCSFWTMVEVHTPEISSQGLTYSSTSIHFPPQQHPKKCDLQVSTQLVPPLQLSLLETPSFVPTRNPKFC